MNRHDSRRRESTIKTLQKAKEQLENELLYLQVNERDWELIADAQLALEYVEIALKRLSIKEPV